MRDNHDTEFKIEFTLGLDTVIGEEDHHDGDQTSPSSVTPYRFGDMVVEALARQLASQVDGDARRELRAKTMARAMELIDARLVPIIDEYLAGEIELTNAYGEKRGKTTMRELIVAEVSKHLKRSGSRHSHDQTPFDKAIAEAAEKAITVELAAEVKAAKDEIRERIRASATAVMAEAIVKGVTAP